MCVRPPGGAPAAHFSSLWPTDITMLAVREMMIINRGLLVSVAVSVKDYFIPHIFSSCVYVLSLNLHCEW